MRSTVQGGSCPVGRGFLAGGHEQAENEHGARSVPVITGGKKTVSVCVVARAFTFALGGDAMEKETIVMIFRFAFFFFLVLAIAMRPMADTPMWARLLHGFALPLAAGFGMVLLALIQ